MTRDKEGASQPHLLWSTAASASASGQHGYRQRVGAIADVVLRYRPPKSRRRRNDAKSGGGNVLQRKANWTHVRKAA
jgi:hypothetical protein